MLPPRNLSSQPLLSLGQFLLIIECRTIRSVAISIIILHDLYLRISSDVRIRIDLDREQRQELGEEPLVHLLVHLIQDKPVSDAAVENVVLDVLGVSVTAEEPVHLNLHQKISDGRGGNLGQKYFSTSLHPCLHY